ncbi:PHD finger protein ING1 [Platanthera guangdongensis]|uniref:PHD finger protein ING1 n=1 Tax=Platanthera guangdongensis TaxID=2320717 RepID=A0ABR2MFB3_9ASPA
MVACDNLDFKNEWFHFGCIGLKEQPKGKWFCPNYASVLKRRKITAPFGGIYFHRSSDYDRVNRTRIEVQFMRS